MQMYVEKKNPVLFYIYTLRNFIFQQINSLKLGKSDKLKMEAKVGILGIERTNTQHLC